MSNGAAAGPRPSRSRNVLRRTLNAPLAFTPVIAGNETSPARSRAFTGTSEHTRTADLPLGRRRLEGRAAAARRRLRHVEPVRQSLPQSPRQPEMLA
jgi:hypothetical protein